MSGDVVTERYRRRVAEDLGISLEELDRGLKRMTDQENAEHAEYRSLSHNDRMKSFANIIDVPLTILAGVDGVSSLLPERRPQPKPNRRPPGKKKPPTKKRASSATPRKRPVKSTVPLKQYPWEQEKSAVSTRAVPATKPKPAAQYCQSCFLPMNPNTGTCGCS